MKSNFTIPNALSMVRLIMIPAIVITYISESYLSAMILVVISGFTDLLDGYIARHFNQISNLGKILDPLADKLTMTAVVVCVTIRHKQMIGLMCVLIAKEILMFCGAYVLFKNGKRPSESKLWGKVSTFLLYLIMAVIMFSDVLSSVNIPLSVSSAVMWMLSIAACLCMILALAQYYPIFWGVLSGTYNIDNERFEFEQQELKPGDKQGE